jgi:5-methylcytosine-specific restriction endonuclease McrA
MGRALQVCAESGCPNLQPCAAHQRQAWSGSDRRSGLPADWRSRRSAVLSRDRGVCQLRYPGCRVRATEVHHAVNRDRHELADLLAVCTACHQVVTRAEAQQARRGVG